MKKCKIIHINDGTAEVATNENRHFAEEYPWAKSILDEYLKEGYEVKQMFPNYTPNIQKDGAYNFFIGGFTVYMEKEE